MYRLVAPISCVLLACGPGPRPAVDGGEGPDASATADADLPDFSRVYAHGNGNLYRIDVDTFEPELVGPITGLVGGSLTDLAIDKNDRALGITLSAVYEIDLDTAVATLLNDNLEVDGFTSLSFVPLDLDDLDSDERLIAASDTGGVYEIDPVDGSATVIGAYGSTGGGETIRSSGDIVAISGIGIFATVTVGTGQQLDRPDYLAEINPATWNATLAATDTGYDRIFGLGYWRGKFYGLVDTMNGGKLIEISESGVAVERDSGGVRWFGAGVATDAPVID